MGLTIVRFVKPGGVAERAGIRCGDRILTINGIEAQPISIWKIHELLSKPETESEVKLLIDRSGRGEEVESQGCSAFPTRSIRYPRTN